MTLSIWRYAHLILAIFSFVFLSIASITGIILAFNSVEENISPSHIKGLNRLSLAETLPVLEKKYLEITEMEITENSYVKLRGLDEEGNDVEGYINPVTGEVIGKLEKKSEFIQWITSFHRSLFLHETGRFIVGINSFLLTLIAISGSILILKRQKKILHFYSKIKKTSFAQYYHVIFGRLLLIPIIIISFTGTYLSMERFNFFPKKENKITNSRQQSSEIITKKNLKDITLFRQIKLSQVKKIEFPFTEEADDYYTIRLKDREIVVNQFTGDIITQTNYPLSLKLMDISLDLHTGRTHIVWAIILSISSLYIFFFIFSGFSITLKRRGTGFKNKYTVYESTIILLVGSENGSTFQFAKEVHKQLLAQNQSSYLAELNNYQLFPKAEYLLIFTSTYGLGDAPSNASKFEQLVKKYPQDHPINYSVIGFGSKAYKDYCKFAEVVDINVNSELWSRKLIKLKTINDKSLEEFVDWVEEWNKNTTIKLHANTKFYRHRPRGLSKMKVEEIYAPEDSENTFILKLKSKKNKYTSGDILVVYPNNDEKERYYSIGKINDLIQLSIKYVPFGLASEYLMHLKPGELIAARIIHNPSFHFPNNVHQVALIANGTGIGPFLGMIEQNIKKAEIHLYCGFRRQTKITDGYKKFLEAQILNKKLEKYYFSFSSNTNNKYVMDLVKRDETFFADLLEKGGILMICGALEMQMNVETVLNEIVFEKYQKRLIDYKLNGQILSDCY